MRQLLARLRFKYLPTKHQRIVKQFKALRGDQTLRLDYPLEPSSVVLDVGGFEGSWAHEVRRRHRCRVFVFEPVPGFVEALRHRFRDDGMVTVLPFGLAARTRTEHFTIAGDGSSAFGASRDGTPLQLVDVREWIESQPLESIHLMKLNIEGGEYELIDRLIETGLIRRIRDLQVQFHRLDRHSESTVARLRGLLAATHEVTYQYDFVWENWRLKSAGHSRT